MMEQMGTNGRFIGLSILWILISIAGAAANSQSGVTGFGVQQTNSSAVTSENDAVKEYFASVLGLRDPNGNGSLHGIYKTPRSARIHTPQYVQNLYDRMAVDADEYQASAGRRRRSLNGGSYNFGTSGSAMKMNDDTGTIQAVAKDPSLAERNGSDANFGYMLEFSLQQLWIPNQQLQLAELVMAVDYTRLTGPPGAYSIYAYAVDNDHGARVLVSTGSLGMLDTFHDNFVKLNVTDAVIRKLLEGRIAVSFEVFVAYNPTTHPNGVSDYREGRRDLTRREIENLLHLSSRGTHQALLVLYSEAAKGIEEDTDPLSQSRRRRRNVARPDPRARLQYPPKEWQNPDTDCRRYEWWIDLASIFEGTVIMPEGFYAFFCGGTCHHPMYHKRWNATTNAHLRGAYNAKWRLQQAKNGSNEPSDVPQPKCVAQTYMPVTVMFNVGSNFIIKRLDDAVVSSCMCA